MPTSTGREEYNGPRGREPRVELLLGGNEILQAEQYQVKIGTLTTPGAFSLTLGSSSGAAKLLALAAPNELFELRINDRTLMTGTLDGQGSTQLGTVTFQGRDVLAGLHRTKMVQEETFSDDTYFALARKLMDRVGMDDVELITSNDANRTRVTGKNSRARPLTRQIEGLRISDGSAGGGAIKKHVQSQLGETAYQFLHRHFERAGLFLWATADGKVVLSEPNPNQAAVYLIQRSHDAPIEVSDIVSHSYKNDTVARFAEIHVYTRGETKRAGRGPLVAIVRDSEMEGWGFSNRDTLRDPNADTEKKAEFMGRRRMAEQRRSSWQLSYTVAGHQTGSPLGGRALWYPDTLVEVDDQELGIQGLFWVEAVTFDGNPRATTTVELMRPRDLIFGDAPT